jgi:hypothetical protein
MSNFTRASTILPDKAIPNYPRVVKRWPAVYIFAETLYIPEEHGRGFILYYLK